METLLIVAYVGGALGYLGFGAAIVLLLQADLGRRLSRKQALFVVLLWPPICVSALIDLFSCFCWRRR